MTTVLAFRKGLVLGITEVLPLARLEGVRPATLAVLDLLRLDPATAGLPVVVCSTAPRDLGGLDAREGEGLYLLATPFDLDRLLAVLATALRVPPPRRGSR